MNCEEARSSLFELVGEEDRPERRLAPEERAALLEHVDGCPTCTADVEAIRAWRTRADGWQDVPVPRWRPSVIERPPWRDWRMWFPVAASTAALALAVFAVVGSPGKPGAAPVVAQHDREARQLLVNEALERFRAEFESRQELDRTLLLQAVVEATRTQREQELAALATVLTAEMDRRALAADESLRYLVTDQFHNSRRLDDLVRRVSTRGNPPENRR